MSQLRGQRGVELAGGNHWGWVQPSLEYSLPNTGFPKRTEKPPAGSVIVCLEEFLMGGKRS